MKKDDLYNTYIKIKDEEHSKQVQERLFELGFNWFAGKNIARAYIDNNTFLGISGSGELGYVSKYSEEFYINQNRKKITYEDLFDKPEYKIRDKVLFEDFNKQFPSLIAFDREVAPIYSEKDLSRVCTVSQIQKHCLDKQIVKEAIGKVAFMKGTDEQANIFNTVNQYKERLLDKLGLNEK